MSVEKIKATDVLAEAFSILWREKELLVLLTDSNGNQTSMQVTLIL